jgi:hypothetical protein
LLDDRPIYWMIEVISLGALIVQNRTVTETCSFYPSFDEKSLASGGAQGLG